MGLGPQREGDKRGSERRLTGVMFLEAISCKYFHYQIYILDLIFNPQICVISSCLEKIKGVAFPVGAEGGKSTKGGLGASPRKALSSRFSIQIVVILS